MICNRTDVRRAEYGEVVCVSRSRAQDRNNRTNVVKLIIQVLQKAENC